jgi:hypothetical protein
MAADIDERSLRLCIYLQSQDAAALIKGKQREDEQPPDVEFAAKLYKFELQSLQTFYSDRALCRRLGNLGLEGGDPLRGRANEAQPVTIKPANIAPKRIASARPNKSSTPVTDISVNVVAKETPKQSDGNIASPPSSKTPTPDTSASVKIVEVTAKLPAAA